VISGLKLDLAVQALLIRARGASTDWLVSDRTLGETKNRVGFIR
jgi:hypothetical protein